MRATGDIPIIPLAKSQGCAPCHGKHPGSSPATESYFWGQCTSLRGLTILIRLEYHLLAFLATLGVGEDELDMDVLVGQQVFDGVAVGVTLHLHALPEGLVVASAHKIAVAERDSVGVTTSQVITQRLPLQRQLSGLDFRESQAFGGPHGLCGGREMGTVSDEAKRLVGLRALSGKALLQRRNTTGERGGQP